MSHQKKESNLAYIILNLESILYTIVATVK